ncbi:uncharacterized protein LOC141648027 isoform X2 [Silene latifolia]|uniref:uncharacterized protein LOC141648027 isoform X2 n=1 Tax=Silene latifolia TaxID=37657 RepID=UPI003D7833FE
MGHELQHNPHNNFQLQSSRNRSIFLEGENDCCLAIEGDQGHQIVANGTVFIESAEKVTVHCHSLSAGFRRVSIIEAIMPCAPLPCPTEEFTVVVQAIHSFVKWPSHLIFPRNMDDDETAKADLQPKNQFTTTSPRSCSSQGSCSRKYIITDKDRAKLTTDLLRVLKNEAMVMKKNDEKIIVPIPTSVCYFSIDVELNYEDMFDWCFQREIGANHISIFMKYLSEKCHKESVSGMYGFCDVNYLSPLSLLEKGERIDYLARVFGWNEGLNINQTFFAPFHENRHWMLAVISPWNGIVWWLNPSGSENEISQFAEEIINEGIIKFSLEHRKDIKKLKRKPLIKWRKPLCPRQPVDSLDCGFYVCRYMLEAIANRHQVIPDQYFKDVPKTYEQQMIDEVRDMWTTFVLKHKEVEDEEDGLEVS